MIEFGKVVGVCLRGDEVIKVFIVIFNVMIWDIYIGLLRLEDLFSFFCEFVLVIFAVESFMYLYLGICFDGLEGLSGYYVVVLDGDIDIVVFGNICMIFIFLVWDLFLVFFGYYVVYVYILEFFFGW